MDKQTIFFYLDKFGIILNIEDGSADAYFEGNEFKKVDLKDLESNSIVVPDEYIKSILDDEIFTSFTYTTYDKGVDYFEDGKVGNFYNLNGNIVSEVHGNKNYKVTLSFDNRHRCTCPVGLRCKHMVASLIKFENIVKELMGKFLETRYMFTKKYPLSKEISINELKFAKYFDIEESEFIGMFPLDKLKDFDLSFKKWTEEDRLRFFEEAEYLLSCGKKKNIIIAYILHIRVSKNLKSYSKLFLNKNKFKNLTELFSSLSIYFNYNLNYNNSYQQIEIDLYSNYVNGHYPELITSYFAHFADNTKYIYYLDEALKYIDQTELMKVFRSLNFNANIDKENSKLLLSKISTDDQVALLKRKPELLLDLDFNLSALELISIIYCARTYSWLDIILKYKDTLANEAKEFMKLLYKTYFLLGYREQLKIIKIAKTLPHSAYVIPLITYQNKIKEEKIGEGETFSEKLKDYYKDINIEDLFYYLDLKYDVKRGEQYPVLEITLNLGNNSCAKATKINDLIQLETDMSVKELNLANFIYDYTMDKFEDEIKTLEEKIREEIKNINKEKELSLFENAFERFSRAHYKEIGASASAKVSLEIYFTLRNNIFNFEFKIGNSKGGTFYKVKSLEKLISYFNNEETYKYGKNLTFTHKLENVVEPYNKLIEYLMKISYLDYYSYVRISLNNQNIGTIFEILNNTKIFVNDKETLINLIPIDANYSIDDNYIAHFDYGKGQIIELASTILIYNELTNEINLLNVSKRDKALYDFFKWSNNRSIESVLDKFKDIVYSMNQDKIKIAESKKEDFKINDIDINAYFDYKDSKVYVENKLFKDGVELSLTDISSPADISKYNTYLNYLSTLGFSDNLIEDEVDLLNFFELDFTYLKSLANVYLSESISNKYVKKLSKMQVSIEKTNNMFEVFLGASEYSDEELTKIFKAIKKKRKFVLLNDNIIKLDEEATNLYQTLEDFNIDINKPKERVLVPTYEALKAYAHEANCNIDSYLANMIEEIKNYKDFNVEIPKINACLRDYQVDGYKWLSVLKKYHIGGILADDMGLGKTLEIITLISADNTNKPSLIVCPKSLVFNWMNEFKKFNPDIMVSEIYGSISDRTDVISNIQKDKNHVYIISYDSLSKDIDTLKNIDFKFVILDEAQTIKNVNAKKSTNVKLLRSEYRFALTGTPIENTVIDLWSLFDFLMPDFLEELSTFKSNYNKDETYTKRLAQKIALFILRRTKTDVLKDLPSKYERIVTCTMNTPQRKYYDSLILNANEKMNNGAKAFEILPYLMRLRQICIDPSLYIENSQETGAKLIELYSIIDEYKKTHKMIIFSQFVQALNIIKSHLDESKISYYMITGDTDAKERLKLANNFNNDSTNVFLVSLKAGGTGLNLIGADTVIHVDPWWNSSAENQATDRAHRIGQKRQVEVIKLICEDSIEQRVIELQNIKKDIIDKLIANDDSKMSKITLDDLSFILK